MMSEYDLKQELRALTEATREQNAILRALVESQCQISQNLQSLESHDSTMTPKFQHPAAEANALVERQRGFADSDREERERVRKVGPGGATLAEIENREETTDATEEPDN